MFGPGPEVGFQGFVFGPGIGFQGFVFGPEIGFGRFTFGLEIGLEGSVAGSDGEYFCKRASSSFSQSCFCSKVSVLNHRLALPLNATFARSAIHSGS